MSITRIHGYLRNISSNGGQYTCLYYKRGRNVQGIQNSLKKRESLYLDPNHISHRLQIQDT